MRRIDGFSRDHSSRRDERAVHLIAAYLRRLAALTHGFYEKTAVLKSSEDKKTRSLSVDECRRDGYRRRIIAFGHDSA